MLPVSCSAGLPPRKNFSGALDRPRIIYHRRASLSPDPPDLTSHRPKLSFPVTYSALIHPPSPLFQVTNLTRFSPLSMVSITAGCSQFVTLLSLLPPSTKPPDPTFFFTLPADPPIPPVPPDPPPVAGLHFSAVYGHIDEAWISGFGVSTPPRSHLSPSPIPPHLLHETPPNRCDHNRFLLCFQTNSALVLPCIEVVARFGLVCVVAKAVYSFPTRSSSPPFPVPQVCPSLLPVSPSHMSISPRKMDYTLVLQSVCVVSLALFEWSYLLKLVEVTNLPQFEDVTKVPQFEDVTKFPRFEDVTSGLASRCCVPCLALFDFCRIIVGRVLLLRANTQRWKESFFSSDSRKKNYPQGLFYHHLVVKVLILNPAFLAASFGEFLLLCNSIDSHSLVVDLVVNEPQVSLHGIICLELDLYPIIYVYACMAIVFGLFDDVVHLVVLVHFLL